MIKKIASAIATASLLLYSFAIPVFAQSTTLEISGNGSGSENEIEVERETETTVVQTNTAKIENKIEAEANTGGNEAEDNTGGDVTIDTGNATTTVAVSNQVNTNIADIDCPTCPGDIDAKISGNGSDSENEIEIEHENETEIYQTNKADIENDIGAESETGDNEVEDNTGGTITVETGNAQTSIMVSNMANANVAKAGNGNNQGTASAWILGNGSDSENEIELELEKSVLIVQENKADIENDIEAESETGDNEVEDNTGGDITVDTGDATTNVEVDNLVNFNWADVDCCLLDILAKISGNGSDSENEIEFELEDELEVFQNNCGKDEKDNHEWSLNGNGGYDGHDNCEIENDIGAESETGDNEVEDNTGPVGDDPVEVTTGDAETGVTVDTSANANTFSQGENGNSDNGLEDLLDGLDFKFSFNLEALLTLLQGLNPG